MTTQDIALRLTRLCREGNHPQAYRELYADDVESIEPPHSTQPHVRGIAAVKEKTASFNRMIKEFHSGFVSEPVVVGNFISLAIEMDLTMQDGSRRNVDELAVFEVKNGKIVKEQFFF